MAMDSPFQNKGQSGFSNSVSQTMGFPSSGEMQQQGAKSLPPQRQQQPFGHKQLGASPFSQDGPMTRPVTSGQQAQGAQFQMHPTKLSPGLSSFMRSWEAQQANMFNSAGIDGRLSALEQAQQQVQAQQAAGPMQVSQGQPSYFSPQQAQTPKPAQPQQPQPAPQPQGPQYSGGPQQGAASPTPAPQGPQPAPSPFQPQGPAPSSQMPQQQAPAGAQAPMQAPQTWSNEPPDRPGMQAPTRPAPQYFDNTAPDRPGESSYMGPSQQAKERQQQYAAADFEASLPADMDPALKKLATEQYRQIQSLKSQFDEGGIYDAKATAALKEQLSKQQQHLQAQFAEAGLGVSSSSAALQQSNLDAMKALASQKMDLGMLQMQAKEKTAAQLAQLYGQLGNQQMQAKAMELQQKSQKMAAINNVLNQALKWEQEIGSAEFNALLGKSLIEAGLDPNDPLVTQMMEDYGMKGGAGGPAETTSKFASLMEQKHGTHVPASLLISWGADPALFPASMKNQKFSIKEAMQKGWITKEGYEAWHKQFAGGLPD